MLTARLAAPRWAALDPGAGRIVVDGMWVVAAGRARQTRAPTDGARRHPILSPVCGRYTNTTGPEEIGTRLGVALKSDAGTRRYNVAPTQEVLALVAPHGETEARMLRWGLIPPWGRDRPNAHSMINARMETVAQKRAYGGLVATATHRALQVADGWYEWLKPERRGEPRQPFHFSVDGGLPFAFAALWRETVVEGESVGSVVLLTCDSAPNDVARAIHDRMPVVLADPELWRAWLDPELGADDVLALCGALPTERLTGRPANPAVNRVKGTAEGPELLVAPAQSQPG
ncbi:MAG: SOS response-associated peptidase [Acidobacteriota bacterium]|nr:SOS response-associated peptidase [Acidobacteriota bacterium]